MANDFLTPQAIAERALATLYETTGVSQLVFRDYSTEFVAKRGDTVTVRKPAVFEAKEFVEANGIEVQDANEDSVPVVMNHFADVSFSVSSKDMALTVDDFDERLLNPALEAIAQKIDRDVLAFRDDITAEVGDATVNPAGPAYQGYDGDYPWSDSRVLIQAGEVLDKVNLPATDRFTVVGPTTRARWAAEPVFREADKRGSTEGLTRASIGNQVSGFDVFMTQNIRQPSLTPATGDPTTEVNVAFHRSGVALVTRPLELPDGVAAAIQSYKGFGIRVLKGFDMNTKKTIVSVDTLYGVKTLDANRAVLIKGADQA
jgi:hypothetical protein